jgi:predicted metal-binding membrane protein
MASLFALGVMSIAWMSFVAGLIAAEKTLPWRRVATYATAAILSRSADFRSPCPVPSPPSRSPDMTRCVR